MALFSLFHSIKMLKSTPCKIISNSTINSTPIRSFGKFLTPQRNFSFFRQRVVVLELTNFKSSRTSLICMQKPRRQFTTSVSLKNEQNFNATVNKSAVDEKAAETAKQRRKIMLSGLVFLFGCVGFASGYIFFNGQPRKDEQGNDIIDEYSHLWLLEQYFLRAKNEFWLYVESVKEPSRNVLLPDPIKPPYYQPKYTVVFEISGVLVHPEWTFSTGWRFKKRQGVDYFLKMLGYPTCELVVYTQENGMTAHGIIDNLDPEQSIMYRLYRDCTKYENGSHIKVLSKLNRDLSKVIFIDWDNGAFVLNPENALRVKKWDGDNENMDLVELANLIRTIVDLDVADVRPVLQYYSSSDDPIQTFRENAKKLKDQETLKLQSADQQKQSFVSRWSGGFWRKS